MNINRHWPALLSLAVFCGQAEAYPREHGPFVRGDAPDAVKFTECSVVKRVDTATGEEAFPRILFFAPVKEAGSPVVKIEPLAGTNTCGWRITVLDGNGVPISAPATNDMAGDVTSVRSADLNQDGKRDFVVDFRSLGCGLAGAGSTHTFLLSFGTRYATANFYSFYFGSEDIVRFKKGGPCYFIHNGLVGNGDEKTRDGRDHNFWVYQLYRFDGSQMIEANRDEPRFPKWVWYTFKENHRETDQLTADQQIRIMGKR